MSELTFYITQTHFSIFAINFPGGNIVSTVNKEVEDERKTRNVGKCIKQSNGSNENIYL